MLCNKQVAQKISDISSCKTYEEWKGLVTANP